LIIQQGPRERKDPVSNIDFPLLRKKNSNVPNQNSLGSASRRASTDFTVW
jgi:hypothetical protein